MAFLRFEIVSRLDRNAALSFIKDCISKNEGWIVDHQLFSNVSASLNFELPAEKVEAFTLSLKKDGIRVFEKHQNSGVCEGDIRGSICITFLHDEPDMKRDVPAFG